MYDCFRDEYSKYIRCGTSFHPPFHTTNLLLQPPAHVSDSNHSCRRKMLISKLRASVTTPWLPAQGPQMFWPIHESDPTATTLQHSWRPPSMRRSCARPISPKTCIYRSGCVRKNGLSRIRTMPLHLTVLPGWQTENRPRLARNESAHQVNDDQGFLRAA